jgi:hypothetical protein
MSVDEMSVDDIIVGGSNRPTRRRPLFPVAAVVVRISFVADGLGLFDRKGPILSSFQEACVEERVKNLPAPRTLDA